MNLPGLWLMELDSDPSLRETAWAELWPRESVEVAEYSLESARSGRACRFIAHRPTARGSARWWDVAVSPIFDRRGDPVQIFCVSRDITELKSTESLLHQELAAKETMLREVNHRIKNALASVASLLSLQARHSQDAVVHACLQQAQSNVIAVAEVHRRLYEMAGHDSLDIGGCIADVVQSTVATLGAKGNVELRTHCDGGVALKADRAIALVLVASELVTNCVKHAFDDGRGTVDVAFTAGPKDAVLRVDDNGRGLGRDFFPEQSTGVGMRIVQRLVKQLDGQLKIDPADHGTHLSVSFPRDGA
jgi:two-component sensor histidine kinase